VKTFLVKADDKDNRLDVFVASKIRQLSRSSIQKLCQQEKVLVNNKVKKSMSILKENDVITVKYNISSQKNVPDIKIPIIYQDNECIVINKPAGILSHSKGAFNPEATVATFIKDKISNDLIGSRAGIVHRLDRATSGVMICAKTPPAMKWLQKQFSSRKVSKTYLAIINGQLDPLEAVIDMPIQRNPKKPQTFRVGSNGKTAQTIYKTLSSNDKYSLIKLTPRTGRTHQLRVHLRHLGHPIVGDTFYDGEVADRLYLHALSIEFRLPSRQQKVFNVPEPAEFKMLMDK